MGGIFAQKADAGQLRQDVRKIYANLMGVGSREGPAN